MKTFKQFLLEAKEPKRANIVFRKDLSDEDKKEIKKILRGHNTISFNDLIKNGLQPVVPNNDLSFLKKTWGKYAEKIEFLKEAKQINEARDDKFDRYSRDIAPYLPKKTSSKYKKGEFGYWWTVEKGNEDIEGKVYNDDIDCSYQDITSLKGCPKEVKGDFDCSGNKLTTLKGMPKKIRGDFDCTWNKKLHHVDDYIAGAVEGNLDTDEWNWDNED